MLSRTLAILQSCNASTPSSYVDPRWPKRRVLTNTTIWLHNVPLTAQTQPSFNIFGSSFSTILLSIQHRTPVSQETNFLFSSSRNRVDQPTNWRTSLTTEKRNGIYTRHLCTASGNDREKRQESTMPVSKDAQLNSTQLNSTQLNSTQLSSIQLNTALHCNAMHIKKPHITNITALPRNGKKPTNKRVKKRFDVTETTSRSDFGLD
ncbi:LAME_0H04368g1_1 [Lachancea meyersii CBS 8951]|uniref:LAME_0H04368g1_1 n=1 Tax=Lachancea meyersii CBS 8951 TaxID=1266667 RepID=A0A1G4KDZ4_9SACH|nr:LAME_0H04368g1_1 [Lachancea meyersii CBS 8951]